MKRVLLEANNKYYRVRIPTFLGKRTTAQRPPSPKPPPPKKPAVQSAASRINDLEIVRADDIAILRNRQVGDKFKVTNVSAKTTKPTNTNKNRVINSNQTNTNGNKVNTNNNKQYKSLVNLNPPRNNNNNGNIPRSTPQSSNSSNRVVPRPISNKPTNSPRNNIRTINNSNQNPRVIHIDSNRQNTIRKRPSLSSHLISINRKTSPNKTRAINVNNVNNRNVITNNRKINNQSRSNRQNDNHQDQYKRENNNNHNRNSVIDLSEARDCIEVEEDEDFWEEYSKSDDEDEQIKELELINSGKVVIQNQEEIEQNDLSRSFDDDLYEPADELNVNYEVSETITSYYNVKHPATIIESKSLASVKLPQLTYKPDLPASCELYQVFNEESDSNSDDCEFVSVPCLSSLQVETISYCGQRHLKFLETNERAGYYIADGTGVGKGREVSGIILDNWMKGRKKSIWFTASNTLQMDAKRDINDIGCGDMIPLLSFPKNCKSKIPVDQNGILFSTYSMLIRNDRYNQLIKWLVKPSEMTKKSKSLTFDELCSSFDGVIVFDEGHSAKNYGIESKKPSQTAIIVEQLQKQLPFARIVYVSATPASDPSHMGYMNRLGLWGVNNKIFPTFPTFCARIQDSGISAMELVAMELKRTGCYCSRHLSYEGTRFNVIDCELTFLEENIYNTVVE